MLASLLLTGLVLAEPGATISYHKKVMIDPDYKPSRTAEQIRTTLSEARGPTRVVHHLSLPPVRRVVYAAQPVAYGSTYEEPRVNWNVGLSYGGCGSGWGTSVGLSYGYPTSYAYAYPGYYSSCGSPFSWSLGLGYRTSWGYLGLGLSGYPGYSSWCGPRYGGYRCGGYARRRYR